MIVNRCTGGYQWLRIIIQFGLGFIQFGLGFIQFGLVRVAHSV